jgi:multidrug efflux pump subunit AcrA (membrane-fusion protein)
MTNSNTQNEHPHSPRHWFVFSVLIIVVAALIVFFGVLPREKVRADIDKQAKDRVDEHPKVDVVKIEPAPAASELVIPGTTLAYTQAAIYARSSGYLTRRLVDIGDHVKKGQLLAVIDAPDLDQQVAQARSAVLTSESNLDQLKAQLVLNKANWERYKVLVAKGVFSRQDGDTQEAAYRSAEANVQAAAATIQANKDNLRRLTVLQQYEQVTAPFTGVITARNVDEGALISGAGSGYGVGTASMVGDTSNAGSSGTTTSSVTPSTGGAQGGDLFDMATLDPLRILVSVPEAYTSAMHVGQLANVSFESMPGAIVKGRVSRTSSSIDSNSRTLLVEVRVSNPQYKYLPGMYVVVSFVEAKTVPPLTVPGESIVVRGGKTMIAKVLDNRVHFEPVIIGRDFGAITEITSGLSPNDVVVKNVNDDIQENAQVQPVFPKQAPPKSTTSQSDAKPGQEGSYGDQSKVKSSQKSK